MNNPIERNYDRPQLEKVIDWLNEFKYYRCDNSPREAIMNEALSLLERVQEALPQRRDL